MSQSSPDHSGPSSAGCAICLVSLSHDDHLIRTLQCGHSFHQQCLKPSIYNCPLCRERITQMFCVNCYVLIDRVLGIELENCRRTYYLCHDCLILKLATKIHKLKSQQFLHLVHFQNIAQIYGNTESAVDEAILSPTSAWNSSREQLSRFFQKETQVWTSQL